jgi:tRNA(fMet)-specific endonuclease VapC
MTYLLDTSVIIALLRGDAAAADFLADHETDTFTTSAICAFEIQSGINRLPPDDAIRHRAKVDRVFAAFAQVYPFDQEQAQSAGTIHATLAQKGGHIGDIDVLIAGAAIASGATLVTQDARHFSRVAGLDMVTL